MRDFDDPTPNRMSLLLPMFLATRAHVWNISAATDGLRRRRTAKAGIGTQMLFGARAEARAAAHDRIEHRLELGDIMMIGRGHDDRQRDATRVDQQHPLAPTTAGVRGVWPDRFLCQRGFHQSPV